MSVQWQRGEVSGPRGGNWDMGRNGRKSAQEPVCPFFFYFSFIFLISFLILISNQV
jgi:hypothetical protein